MKTVHTMEAYYNHFESTTGDLKNHSTKLGIVCIHFDT